MKDPNENRRGYKKTKVGWIPHEWDVQKLKVVAGVQTGLAKGKSNLKDQVSLPYLRVANVQDGHVNLHTLKKIEVERSQVERYRLHKGDVLFTEGGDYDKLGRGCVWDGSVDPCLHQNHVFVVRCDPSSMLPYLLATIASGPHGRHYFALSSKQSTNLASINSTQLKSFPLPLPPLLEQQKIAEILSTWDEEIEQARKLIDAKKRRKKGLMQQLLTGKKRLPGFSGDWTAHKLGTAFKERCETGREDLPLLAITGGRGVIPADQIERKDSSNSDKSRYKRIAVGDIGYNTMRMWQGVNALSSLEGIVSPAYTICIPSDKLCGTFLSYYFKFQPVVHWFYRYSQGLVSDTWNLKFHHFAQISLPFPKREEQEAIGAVLKAADKDITWHEQELAALEKQKRGLMQKLLTGTVRVKV